MAAQPPVRELLFERELTNEPATHAFVIGVGDYPHRQPQWGGLPDLANVPNLASAADSAKFVSEWLLRNQDSLTARLGSLDILISDPPGGANRYPWAPGHPVDAATEANVKLAGKAWFDRLRKRAGDVALFYCCGHGAAHTAQPVLFLEDLNREEANPWSHLNIGNLGQKLRKLAPLRSAYMFSDTCSEFLPSFEFGDALETRFWQPPSPFDAAREKVMLLRAAPDALLAYEGADPKTGIKLGRFTQTIMKGLDGSSARLRSDKWAVHPSELFNDLKALRRIYYPLWDDLPFEPSPVYSPNDGFPIVNRPDPDLPLLIMTNPEEAVTRFNLHVSDRNDRNPPWIVSKQDKAAGAWLTSVKGGEDPLYALAMTDTEFFSSRFFPREPQFDQRVNVQ